MTLNKFVVYAGPFAIWSLVAGQVLDPDRKDSDEILADVGLYIGIQLTCQIIHGTVLLPLLYSKSLGAWYAHFNIVLVSFFCSGDEEIWLRKYSTSPHIHGRR